jgi:hypothetical protein
LHLLVGSLLGLRSPVEVVSPSLALGLKTTGSAALAFPLDPGSEHAVLPLAGPVEIDGEPAQPGQFLHAAPVPSSLRVHGREPAHLLLIGGRPFNEKLPVW